MFSVNHMNRYGYRGMGRGSGGGCYTCGEVGHLSRECPHLRSCRDGSSSNGACFRCGGSGHMARHCNRSTNSSGQSCFNCGGLGHMARDCTSKRSKSYGGNGAGLGGPCYSCDKPGHTARDCPETPSSPGRPTTSCFHCGVMGHFARECPNWSKTLPWSLHQRELKKRWITHGTRFQYRSSSLSLSLSLHSCHFSSPAIWWNRWFYSRCLNAKRSGADFPWSSQLNISKQLGPIQTNFGSSHLWTYGWLKVLLNTSPSLKVRLCIKG